MGFFDNYRSSLKKVLENQAKDKSKDPAERSPKKATPKKDGLAEQLAMQQAKYSTGKNRASQPPPSAVYERNKASAEARKNAAPTSVTPTSRPKAPPPFFSDEPPRRQKAASAPKQKVQIGTSPTPKAAKPTPPLPVPDASRTVSTPFPTPRAFRAPKAASYDPKNNEADRNADAAARAKKAAENPRDHREPTPAPKLRNYSTEAADRLKKLGLGEDNAVVGRLRERAVMSQKERDKPFGEDNEVLKKLRAAGYNFAKGGKISGAARKGKTKGRYI